MKGIEIEDRYYYSEKNIYPSQSSWITVNRAVIARAGSILLYQGLHRWSHCPISCKFLPTAAAETTMTLFMAECFPLMGKHSRPE